MSEIAREACNLVRGILTSAILSGVLAVVVGVVILAWPEPSVVTAAVFFGSAHAAPPPTDKPVAAQ
jgi:uncharacterized membrane protein HdeD (DUF308 family)